MTLTDFGPTVIDSLPPFTVTETGSGTTVLGAANVFTLSTAFAVSVSAFADLNAMGLRSRSERPDPQFA
jgi:hypothetical protein